jgi:hypothetical protein
MKLRASSWVRPGRLLDTPDRYRHFDAPIFLHNAVLDKR